MIFSQYETSTGLFTSVSMDAQEAPSPQAGFSWVEGLYPYRSYKVVEAPEGLTVVPFEVPPPPLTEQKIRQQRYVLLTQSDWTQVVDSPLSEEKRLEWAAYRTALRDIPEQEGFPETVIWPTVPA